MIEETEEKLQEQLLVVNSAIQRLIAGETIQEFSLSSGGMHRKYRYGEVTLEALQKEKSMLLVKLNEITFSPKYRPSSVMQTIYRKL